VKIAFIVHPVSGSRSSPESLSTHIWVHEVARRLAGEHEPIVYTGRSRSASEPAEYRDGVLYRRISIPSHSRWANMLSRTPLLWRVQGHISFRSGWYYAGHALQIAADVRRRQCDVVHIINLSQFAPIIRAINPRTKIVLHMCSEWLTRIDRGAIESRLRKVDRILGCSDFVTNQIRRAFPGYSDRCATIYCGVDTSRFETRTSRRARPDGAKRILFVGGVSPHKGLHVLLGAFQEVLKRCPEAVLEIAGPEGVMIPVDWLPTLGEPEEMAKLLRFYDGRPYMQHLKEQIESLNLQGRVTFSGLLPRSELARRYSEADLFVFPSLWNELFGMPMAEAMASGVPVVAARIAGIPEVVENGRTGLLVERANPSALAGAIVQLLQNDGLRQTMGRAGRQRVLEKFTWERIADELLRQYGGTMPLTRPLAKKSAAQGAA
jgi:glycosyltransferase involved in cell wall biosynthesis